MKSFPMKKVKSYMDKIYDKYRGDNFWEVKGSRGGDTLRMRFYDDGLVTEK
jgi:hypothetical protein